MSAALASVAIVLTVIFGVQSPAMAEANTIIPPAGVGGYGYYDVNYDTDTLTVSVTSGSLAPGYCLTTYVDIVRTYNVGRSGGHWDIRAARTCQSHSYRTSGAQNERSMYGINITGIQKLSVCYGPLNQMGTCNHIYGSLQGVNPSFNSNNMCSRAWTKAANGSNFYFNGGKPESCQD